MNEVEIIEVGENQEQQQQKETEEIETTQQHTPKQSQQRQQYQRDQQYSKDRTLFCINIDERCTEDILFELFLQVSFKSLYSSCNLNFFFLF